MMRRLLEIVLIEAFEAKALAPKITGKDGNYLQLQALLTQRWPSPSSSFLVTAGSTYPTSAISATSAHGRYFLAQRVTWKDPAGL
jgi:hypothetical protein